MPYKDAQSPEAKYSIQKAAAKIRGIEWNFTFEDWCEVWQDSGHWAERSPTGYVMCRYNDEGPYSIDNIYIAHSTQNQKDQWVNGHGKGGNCNKTTLEDRLYIKNYPMKRGEAKILAERYGISVDRVYTIRCGRFLNSSD